MSVELNYDLNFSAAVAVDKIISPTAFTARLSLRVVTENPDYQNIAMQRILFFVREILDGSIFVNSNDSNFYQLRKMCDQRILDFPEDPHEQVVGMILFQKFAAITEGYFEINELQIGSGNFKGLTYTIDEFITLTDGTLSPKNVWWNSNEMTYNTFAKDKKDALFTWDDVGLSWEGITQPDDQEIIFEPEKNITKPRIFVLEGDGPEHKNPPSPKTPKNSKNPKDKK